MPTYECIQCKYQTTRRNDYTKHLETLSHQELMQKDLSLLCECCNKVFATKRTLSKHKTSNRYNQHLNNNKIITEIQKISEQTQKLSVKIDKQDIATQNISTKITKINRSVNNYNRSVMRILKEDYSNNPALEELTNDEIILAIEQEYKEKYVENIKSEDDARLQKKILADFENNKMTDVIGKIILNFIKKESKEHQSVFNTDFSRSNYATKTNENWLNDKLGLKFKDLVLKPLVNVINKIITSYDYYLIRCAKNNKLDNDVYNHLVDNKIKLLDFIDYVKEPKNQEQIIYKISPQLQLEYAK